MPFRNPFARKPDTSVEKAPAASGGDSDTDNDVRSADGARGHIAGIRGDEMTDGIPTTGSNEAVADRAGFLPEKDDEVLADFVLGKGPVPSIVAGDAYMKEMGAMDGSSLLTDNPDAGLDAKQEAFGDPIGNFNIVDADGPDSGDDPDL